MAEGNEVDVDRAVAVARRAFEGPWRTMRASERGQLLLRLVDLMKKHADEIAALESLDAGKPISGVLRQDFPAAVDTLTYYAGWADKISGEVVSTRDDALTLYGAIIVKLHLRSFRSPCSTQVATISSSRPNFDWLPRAVTVKGGRRPSRSNLPLTVTSTAAGWLGRSSFATTIRGELAIGRGDRATTLYSVDPCGSEP